MRSTLAHAEDFSLPNPAELGIAPRPYARRKILVPLAIEDDGRPVRLGRWHVCGQRLEIGFHDFDGRGWQRASYFAHGRRCETCPHCAAELTTEAVLSDFEADALIARARGAERVNVGRGGTAQEIVAAMWIDYQRGLSLAAVGALYDRTRQAIFGILQTRAAELREKEVWATPVEWQGRTFAPGKHGYFRATSGGRELLHCAIWRATHGAVPPGMKLRFKDGDRHHCTLENLEVIPASAQILAAHAVQMKTRRNQFTVRPEVTDEELYADYLATGSLAEAGAKRGLGSGAVFERVRTFCLTKRKAA